MSERLQRLNDKWGASISGALLILFSSTFTYAMNMTTVQGTVYRADGSPVAGTAIVSWPAFTTAANDVIAAGTLTTNIGQDGFVTLNLVANASALPQGTYYTVVYHLADGTVNKEYWVVPEQANAPISAVRSQLAPATIAVQPVTKSYVDASITNVGSNFLPTTGGGMRGPLTLNGDPTADSQAATKRYVDSSNASTKQAVLGSFNCSSGPTGPSSSSTYLGGDCAWHPADTAANATQIQGVKVASSMPADQQSLVFQASTGQFVPGEVLSIASAAQTLASAAQSAANGAVKQSGGTLTGPLTGPAIGGFNYAAQRQTGAGNNGIANSMAQRQVLIVDPGYANSEQYTMKTLPAPDQSALIDYRNANEIHYFHNWNPGGAATNSFGDAGLSAFQINCLENGGLLQPGNQGHHNCSDLNEVSSAPGFDNGSVPIGPGGWMMQQALAVNETANSAGITEGFLVNQKKYGNGDNIAAYFYNDNSGGAIAGSDEGSKVVSFNQNETSPDPKGTIISGAGLGSVSVKAALSSGSGNQGVGRYLVDLTAAPIAGTITSIGAFSTVSTATVTATVPISNAWGTIAASVATPKNDSYPFTTSETINVNVTSGRFDTSHLMCFANLFHECEYPTAVGTPTGGVQSVTVPLVHALLAGYYVFQGGMAGYGFESPAYSLTTGSNLYRYVHDIFGSTDAHTLITGDFGSGQAHTLRGLTDVQNYGLENLSSCSNAGATITCTLNPAGSTLVTPYIYWNQMTIDIANATDAALNGPCKAVTFTSAGAQGTFNCTHAGLSGSYGPEAATAINMNSAGTNNLADFIAYPMALVLDVQNYTTSPVSVDGTFVLEPNIIPFANGDTVEEPHHITQVNAVATMNEDLRNPFAGNQVLQLRYTGHQSQATVINFQGADYTQTPFRGYGGFLYAPQLMAVTGAYNGLISTTYGPTSGQNAISINPSSVQYNDVNYNFNVLYLNQHGGSASYWQNTAYTGANVINSAGPLTLAGSSVTLNGAAAGTSIVGTGGGTVSGAVNGALPFTIENSSNSAAAYTTLNIQESSDATQTLKVQTFAPAWTASGLALPKSSYLATASGLLNGLVFNTEANAPLKFATNNTARLVCDGSGNCDWGNTNLTAATPASSDNSTRVATTEFVKGQTSAATGVVPGSYTNANVVIGADGRVTAASNGSGVGGTSNPMGASGPSHSSGLVPDPGAIAGTTRYLREDGTWVAPSGFSSQFPLVVAHASLMGRTSSVASLFSYTPSADGTFRITVTLTITSTCTSGNIQMIAWLTPVSGHTNGATTGVACSSPFNTVTYTGTYHNIAGGSINPSTNFSSVVGSPVYNVDAVLEQLQ